VRRGVCQPRFERTSGPDRARVAGCPALIARLLEQSARNLLFPFEKMPQGL
jgi:hypothetical protein